MSAMGEMILAIDEEIANLIALKKNVNEYDLEDVAIKLSVPAAWVKYRYNDMLSDW